MRLDRSLKNGLDARTRAEYMGVIYCVQESFEIRRTFLVRPSSLAPASVTIVFWKLYGVLEVVQCK